MGPPASWKPFVKPLAKGPPSTTPAITPTKLATSESTVPTSTPKNSPIFLATSEFKKLSIKLLSTAPMFASGSSTEVIIFSNSLELKTPNCLKRFATAAKVARRSLVPIIAAISSFGKPFAKAVKPFL